MKPEKPTLKFISPVLASADVTRDIKWYEEKLGFKNVYDSSAYQDGEIDYAVVGRDNLYMHLQFQFPEDMISTDVKFEVENIELLYQELIKAKVIKEEQIRRKTPWNTSEVSFFDLSKNRITFLEDL
jgi:catechol 2,3-dioxygenase-like lactoylglutathione lyase family enzyme